MDRKGKIKLTPQKIINREFFDLKNLNVRYKAVEKTN